MGQVLRWGRRLVRATGFDVVPYRPAPRRYPPDFDAATIATIDAVRPFTMTSEARIFGLCSAVRYITKYEIPGDIVECGVWRGGSMMAAARTLVELGDTSRDLYLFDTFDGMVEPGEFDRRHDGVDAKSLLDQEERDGAESAIWCRASLEDVQANMATVGYPSERLHFVRGAVEQTIPDAGPAIIALLRLDTDWYESTRHELTCLFPRVSSGGVLIIDDYGFWAGARRAVDEYFDAVGKPVLLHRIDATGRAVVVT